MVKDIVGGGGAREGIGCLFSWNYPQNLELVCDSGKQTMTIRGDLERYQSDGWTTRGSVCGRCAIRSPEVGMSDLWFLLLPLSPFLSGHPPVGCLEGDVERSLPLSVPSRCCCRLCLSKLEETCKPVSLKTLFCYLFSVSGAAAFFPEFVRDGYH